MEKLTPLFLDSPAFLRRSCGWGAMGVFATQSLFRICRDPQTLKRFSPGCGNLEAALLHVLILNHSLCVRSASIKSLHRIGLHKANCPKKAEVCLPNGVRQSAKALQHPAGNHESHKRASAGGALKAALRLLEQHPQAQGIKRKCPFQANLANNAVPLGFCNLKKGMAAPARCVLHQKMQTEQRAQMPEPASSPRLKLEANASFGMCQTCKALCCSGWHTIPAVPKAQKTRTAFRFPGNQKAARRPPSLQGLRPPYAPGKCSDFCETDPRPLMDCVTTGAP